MVRLLMWISLHQLEIGSVIFTFTFAYYLSVVPGVSKRLINLLVTVAMVALRVITLLHL